MIGRATAAGSPPGWMGVGGGAFTGLVPHRARLPFQFNACILAAVSMTGSGVVFPEAEDEPVGLDAQSFRSVMGSLAVGVTVVTTTDRQGEPRGLTATAVCSVSLDPPLILVCIDRTADCYESFLTAEVLAVNLLQERQEGVSRRFAQKVARKFDGIGYRSGVTGAPILADVLAYVECRIRARHPGGDHTILVGEAVAHGLASPPDACSPLLHYRGSYARLGGRLPADPS